MPIFPGVLPLLWEVPREESATIWPFSGGRFDEDGTRLRSSPLLNERKSGASKEGCRESGLSIGNHQEGQGLKTEEEGDQE